MRLSKVHLCFFSLWISVPLFGQVVTQNPLSPNEALEQRKKKMILADGLNKRSGPGIPFKFADVSPLTALQATMKGAFWRDPEWVKSLELTPDQQDKMDEIFRQHRLKLIDLNAQLQKEELILEPLFRNVRPTPEVESKIVTQIDQIADARAELEKANSRMLISILQVLTPEQRIKLPISSKKTGFYLKK